MAVAVPAAVPQSSATTQGIECAYNPEYNDMSSDEIATPRPMLSHHQIESASSFRALLLPVTGGYLKVPNPISNVAILSRW
jgi:hypothetical protein